MSEQQVPWYKVPTSSPPFALTKKIYSNASDSTPFKSLAFFPWTHNSYHTLWNGHHNLSQEDWSVMINEFSDAIAVGSDYNVYVFFMRQSKNPISYKVPFSDHDIKALSTDCIRVAWTLDPGDPLEPLLLFSHLNLLYIYNVKKQGVQGYLRGHGGAITSIVVHPINTNLFCTTSRDYSTRIYDLLLKPQKLEDLGNPHWPPGTKKSFAGAAHGLHMTEPEGEGNGIGRCIIILMGGRSGGHQAAVLSAAFNPDFPVIATCGLDRLVKIWHVPRASKETLIREDKPLFSSGRIHKARVLSISWLQNDLLLSHSAPAVMKRTSGSTESRKMWLEPGQIVIWLWLSLNRFFPAKHSGVRQDILRGCASDYQESSSFKTISAISFPSAQTQFDTPALHLYQSPTHDPVVSFTYPKFNSIKLFNVIHLHPRKPPPFPFDVLNMEIGEHLNENGERGIRSQTDIPPEVSGWEISPVAGTVGEEILACAMGMEGTTLIGVGSKEGKGIIWIWKL
ncbi:hypothetical protein H2248_000926 [Termitomyces sp. 'cryptogamus']|nr:hypothetical protein H2248_000926 [Termitomyces sp. 'cryptogamus']